MTEPTTCQIDGCVRPIAYPTRGWCSTHYGRLRKHGTTDPNPRCMFEGTWEDRFWAKVDRSDADGCWEWTAHRSHNPPCVRPDHLWVGTASDNMRDAYAKGRKSNMPATLAAQAKARARRESVA